MSYHSKHLPPGAVVLIDGKHRATVVQAFPEGSTSYVFPHYIVNVEHGDRGVAIAMNRCAVKVVNLFDLSKSLNRGKP
jgi:hypothetical protein